MFVRLDHPFLEFQVFLTFFIGKYVFPYLFLIIPFGFRIDVQKHGQMSWLQSIKLLDLLTQFFQLIEGKLLFKFVYLVFHMVIVFFGAHTVVIGLSLHMLESIADFHFTLLKACSLLENSFALPGVIVFDHFAAELIEIQTVGVVNVDTLWILKLAQRSVL